MFVYYINVPMNQKGIDEFENYESEMPNVQSAELTEDEFYFLRKQNGLFSRFDDECGTIIDTCEEERIEFEYLDNAIQATKDFLKQTSDEKEKKLFNKILELLNLAKNSNTFFEIDSYVE